MCHCMRELVGENLEMLVCNNVDGHFGVHS